MAAPWWCVSVRLEQARCIKKYRAFKPLFFFFSVPYTILLLLSLPFTLHLLLVHTTIRPLSTPFLFCCNDDDAVNMYIKWFVDPSSRAVQTSLLDSGDRP